jgi:hypothetical protein
MAPGDACAVAVAVAPGGRDDGDEAGGEDAGGLDGAVAGGLVGAGNDGDAPPSAHPRITAASSAPEYALRFTR